MNKTCNWFNLLCVKFFFCSTHFLALPKTAAVAEGFLQQARASWATSWDKLGGAQHRSEARGSREEGGPHSPAQLLKMGLFSINPAEPASVSGPPSSVDKASRVLSAFHPEPPSGGANEDPNSTPAGLTWIFLKVFPGESSRVTF